jgi:hypothetical protein
MEVQDRNLINRKFRTNISWAEYFRLREEVTRIDTELGDRLDQEDSMTLEKGPRNIKAAIQEKLPQE